jgi:hypothetical protein
VLLKGRALLLLLLLPRAAAAVQAPRAKHGSVPQLLPPP